MSIFSNLTGTMKNVFMLGKRGLKLKSSNNELQVMKYNETDLAPISAADPQYSSHLVTLGYFNTHGGGGSGGNANILIGTTDPLPSQGEDKDVYFKVDNNNILGIFIKDTLWKPYETTVVKAPFSKNIDKSSWVQDAPDRFILSIPSSEHLRGTELIIDTFQNTQDSITSSAPYQKNIVEIEIQSNGDLQLISSLRYSGKVIISGE